ncbi:MAG: TldD/PmbA family protein [Dehalococcoidia bacterium]|nr:TldD/PmbA family protein [Dehalococcoidia bacterium]
MPDPEPILAAARRAGAQQAEVFHLAGEETPVRFEANRLKELNSRHSSGVALRVIANGRIGFASSTRPGDVDDLVAAALETAPFGPEARLDFPGTAEAPGVETYDPPTEALAVDEMVHTGQSLIDAVRAAEPELVCDASVRRSVQTVTLANSNGGRFSYRSSGYSAWVNGTLIRGTDMLFVGDADASCRAHLDLKGMESTVKRQLDYCRRNAVTRTAELPVIFTAIGVAEALAGPLTIAFSGRMVHQAQSPLAGCLGKEMYDTRFSMYDDATISFRPAARPVDDEGVPSRRIPLIEKGVVRAFLYDLQTAGLAGAETTGSAERSLTSQPSISTTTLMLETGDTTFAEMVRGVKEGLVVEELMGAGQGNVMGGDFSGNVLLGYKIENGEIVGRVKDTMVAGNVHEALRRLVAIGSEGRWVGGSLFTSPLWFDRLAVSAKA